MESNGFLSLEERLFFEDLADQFIYRAELALADGRVRKYQLTEMVLWNGQHQITLTRWDVLHCGGKKPFKERNNIDLSIRLRKMVTGQ